MPGAGGNGTTLEGPWGINGITAAGLSRPVKKRGGVGLNQTYAVKINDAIVNTVPTIMLPTANA